MPELFITSVVREAFSLAGGYLGVLWAPGGLLSDSVLLKLVLLYTQSA